MKSAMMLLLALIVAPEVAMATNAKGLAYLAENKAKEGVVELPCALLLLLLLLLLLWPPVESALCCASPLRA